MTPDDHPATDASQGVVLAQQAMQAAARGDRRLAAGILRGGSAEATTGAASWLLEAVVMLTLQIKEGDDERTTKGLLHLATDPLHALAADVQQIGRRS